MANTNVTLNTDATIAVITNNFTKVIVGAEQGPPGVVALTTNGDSGPASFSNSVLNIPTPTVLGLGAQPALGYTAENIANKTTDLTSNDNTHYPTTAAVNTGLASKQNSLGYTPANKAGDTFTGAISATNLSGTNTGDNATSVTGILKGNGTSISAAILNTDYQSANYTIGGTGSVTRTVVSKLSDNVSVLDFGAVGDGVTSNVIAFQSAMSYLVVNGGTLKIPKGSYWFSITGDSSTIQIPSNVTIVCEEGVTFLWDYWATTQYPLPTPTPLFAIINKTNVRFSGNNCLFIWKGVLGQTVGSVTKFGYGGSGLAAYEWGAHICCFGSSYVVLEDLRCKGNLLPSDANYLTSTLNIFISWRGNSDLTAVTGNVIRNIIAQDVCQCIAGTGQSNFLINNIQFSQNSSASMIGNVLNYGPNHCIYFYIHSPCSYGIIENIIDIGWSNYSGNNPWGFTIGAQTLSLKNINNVTISNIRSLYESGIVNFENIQNVKFQNLFWQSTGTDADPTGAIYAIADGLGATSGDIYFPNSYIIFEDVTLNMLGEKNACLVNLGAITASQMKGFIGNFTITRNEFQNSSTSSIVYVGDYGVLNINYKNIGTADKVVIAVNTSNYNNFYIYDVNAAGRQPRATVDIYSTYNKINIYTDSQWQYNSYSFTPSNGNKINFVGIPQSIGNNGITPTSTTNPSYSFTLPNAGAYLVNINIIDIANNDSRQSLYWVVFDLSTNSFTVVQQIGTSITKGVNAPSAMTVTVTSAGVVSITSTALAKQWRIIYGYFQIGR